MSFVKSLAVSVFMGALAAPAFAADIEIHDAYARTSTPTAKAGGAFFHIMNKSDQDDRLVAVSSDVAPRTELHTHKDMGDGVMKMMEVEEGFVIPAGGMHALERGGDHVMFMGLSEGFKEGETVSVTLTFENAGDITVDIPVDLERGADHKMDHGDMDHSKMDHGDMKHDDKSN
ncbi:MULTISPECIES: copper chaperone PCu(A)C [Halocynthiibacter]|uniref:Copper chaperone PCu(A)C n=1 Tax=Halocynthiibacter halioticoli TaxID=2986804 RepID=A0AAE3J0P7_9RHOB|nr:MULTISPECIES: copper chaperone PCu(A)C [Halocynthiibacter]MCV6825214.1 copper chaperone PCu(A)C [Halocynthiibacter halioticoli]MCW4058215.1 copper chaperone PCu(A)C [Halocynthiibacter sp. SDUM655004]